MSMCSNAFASTLLCALLASISGAAETTIDWTIKPYADSGVSVGDKVTFAYDATQHNVLIHPTNDCAEDGAVEIGPLGNDVEASVTHTFTEAEAGTTVTFTCDVGSHCEVGQIVKFIVGDVVATDVEPVPASEPDPSAEEPPCEFCPDGVDDPELADDNGRTCGQLFDAIEGGISPSDPRCTFIQGQQELCCPGSATALAPFSTAPRPPSEGPPCEFCPKGLEDPEKIVAHGRTCKNMASFAATVPGGDPNCANVLKRQENCCSSYLAAMAPNADTTINWTIKPYDDVTASVGDSVAFKYDATAHNVLIHPTNDCTEDGAIEIGPMGTEADAFVIHTFTEAEAGTTVTFACDIGRHCEVGQIVKFIVSDVVATDAAAGTPEDVPEEQPPAPEPAPEPVPDPEVTAPAHGDIAGVAVRGKGVVIAAATLLAADLMI